MQKPEVRQIWLAGMCIWCIVAVLSDIRGLNDTNFGRGSISGPLLWMSEGGLMLFLLAVGAAFVRVRIAAVIALASILLCLPFFLFFFAPPAIVYSGDEFNVPAAIQHRWEKWLVVGLVSLLLTAYWCVCILAGKGPEAEQHEAKLSS